MTIMVCPLSRVPEIVTARRPSHVVSLLDPETRFPDARAHGAGAHLQVAIHDITEPKYGHTHPAADHVRDILDFLSGWEREAPVLIHCYAGLSRSTATAYVAACLHNPRADEAEIAFALRRACSNAWPNSRIVALADAELGRNGRMRRAIEAIGPGRAWHEIGENTPFEFASRYDQAS